MWALWVKMLLKALFPGSCSCHFWGYSEEFEIRKDESFRSWKAMVFSLRQFLPTWRVTAEDVLSVIRSDGSQSQSEVRESIQTRGSPWGKCSEMASQADSLVMNQWSKAMILIFSNEMWWMRWRDSCNVAGGGISDQKSYQGHGWDCL